MADELDFGPEESEEGETSIPSFQGGGRVRETGIALVHEGEFIMPAPGSEAEVEPVGMQDESVVNYYFPVEIIVVGSLPEEERELITTRVWEQLGDVLRRMA